MQYLIMYILTILFSITGEALLSIKLVKDVARNGYLIDFKKLKDAEEKTDIKSSNSLIKYIPLLNILETFKNMINYNNARDHILTDLSVLGVLKEMTDEEKEKYNKKPSIFRVLKIDVDREIKLEAPSTSTLEIYNKSGKIWYEKLDKDYIILKATGSAEDLSKFTQINLIEEHIYNLMEDGIKYYGDPLVFLRETKDCKNYNELEKKVNEQKQLREHLYKQAQEQPEKIEMKNSITSQKESITEEQVEEKPKTLRRKL